MDPDGLQATVVQTPYGPMPFIFSSGQQNQLTPQQWEGMKEFIGLFNPIPFYEYLTGIDRLPDACEFGRGKGDKYGPLWKAPGMPGWEHPANMEPHDPDWWKRPADWDKMTKWQKFKWWAKKAIGAATGAGGVGM